MKKKVIIVQRRLTHYRVAFFESLRLALEERGIELQLLIGTGTPEECQKQDSGDVSWAIKIPTRYFFKNKLCWQPIYKYVSGADLVIVTQENALLANHLMVLRSRSFRLAFWGHGANLQSLHPDGIKERFKRWTAKRVDWWFPYTQMSADLVLASGYPTDRMTVINNSINTVALRRHLESVTKNEIRSLKTSMGFSGGPIGVYIGSLYANKRLRFLFTAAESIQKSLGSFNLLIIGDGPERHLAQSFCEKHSWAYWAGVQHERNKAVFLASAEVMLSPGAVGLGILDSFVCQAPMITTDSKGHGPEISYLENWCNGVITSNDIDDYVNSAVKLLENPELLSSMRKGCETSAEFFSMNNMVNNFASGVSNALMFDRGGRNGA